MLNKDGTVTDFQGTEIKIGSRVVFAFREANQARLRIGKVLGFGTRGWDMATTILVKYDVIDGFSRPTEGFVYASRVSSLMVLED